MVKAGNIKPQAISLIIEFHSGVTTLQQNGLSHMIPVERIKFLVFKPSIS
jgi:hypothetical protein